MKVVSTQPDRAILLLSIGFVLLIYRITVAQSSEGIEPVVSYGSSVQLPDYLYWSNDSLTLVFADAITLPTDEWYSYSVNTRALTASDQWPLYSSAAENDCPDISRYYRVNGQEVPPFISPNGRFLAYIAEQVDDASVRIAVADCQDDYSLTLPDRLTIMDRVLWSSDSSAFVTVDIFIPDVFVNYVSNYTDDVSNAVLRVLTGWSHKEQNYTVKNAFDISSDGNRVLLLVASNSDNLRLYIYDAQSPYSDILIENFAANQVVAGAFAPNDETKVWLLGETGIVQYDLQTGETTLLNTKITSTATQTVPSDTPALFSPNGLYLAALQETGLYVVDLSQHIPLVATLESEETATPVELLRLILTVDCPATSRDWLTWHVRNPNSEALAVQWEQFGGTSETHSIDVPGGRADAPGEATFETAVEFYEGTAGTLNTASIYVDGVFHDQRSCFVPRGG